MTIIQKGEPMNDLISRQAAIDALKEKVFQNLSDEFYGAMQVLDELPPAEVEPVKRGKWIYDNQFHWYRASCSECGYKRVTDIKAEKWNGWKYCPSCGAKMDAEEGEPHEQN